MSDSDTSSTVPAEVAEETLEHSVPEKSVETDQNYDPIVEKGRHDHYEREYHDRTGDNRDQYDDVVRDVVMWRRRKISAALVAAATVLWLMLEVYRFNFVPLASYTAIGFVTLLFLYASSLALLRKEVSDMKGWDISEEKAKEMADTVKRLMEKGIRWMFHVSYETEWYFFTGIVSGLFLLGYIGRHFNLLTLLYAGTMVLMTVPVIYAKREKQIKAYGERMKAQATSLNAKFHEKVMSKWKPKREEIKQKKVE